MERERETGYIICKEPHPIIVVYLEPYPDEEAKAILKNVPTEFFQGVTFKAYFRLYGEEK